MGPLFFGYSKCEMDSGNLAESYAMEKSQYLVALTCNQCL